MIEGTAILGFAGTLGGIDISIVVVAVLLLFVISYVFGREEKDTNDFFLGRRRVPSIVACLSFAAAEISALTIVGFPATAYNENWEYVPFLLARLWLVFQWHFSFSRCFISMTVRAFTNFSGIDLDARLNTLDRYSFSSPA